MCSTRWELVLKKIYNTIGLLAPVYQKYVIQWLTMANNYVHHIFAVQGSGAGSYIEF
jgi:hypothetical protein